MEGNADVLRVFRLQRLPQALEDPFLDLPLGLAHCHVAQFGKQDADDFIVLVPASGIYLPSGGGELVGDGLDRVDAV